MLVINRFYGLRIEMYFLDQGEPHFHDRYGEYSAKSEIQSLELTRGSLPGRAFQLAVEWAGLHQEELMQNWRLTQTGRPAIRIDPLI